MHACSVRLDIFKLTWQKALSSWPQITEAMSCKRTWTCNNVRTHLLQPTWGKFCNISYWCSKTLTFSILKTEKRKRKRHTNHFEDVNWIQNVVIPSLQIFVNTQTKITTANILQPVTYTNIMNDLSSELKYYFSHNSWVIIAPVTFQTGCKYFISTRQMVVTKSVTIENSNNVQTCVDFNEKRPLLIQIYQITSEMTLQTEKHGFPLTVCCT